MNYASEHEFTEDRFKTIFNASHNILFALATNQFRVGKTTGNLQLLVYMLQMMLAPGASRDNGVYM